MPNQITVEDAEDIIAKMWDYGVTGAEIYEGYSGRGMYGDTVTGIQIENDTDMIALGWAARDLEIDLDRIPKRMDNLGRGFIVY